MSLATLNIVLIHYLEKWLEPNYLGEKLVLVSTITENNPIKDIMKRESPVQSDFDPDSYFLQMPNCTAAGRDLACGYVYRFIFFLVTTGFAYIDNNICSTSSIPSSTDCILKLI